MATGMPEPDRVAHLELAPLPGVVADEHHAVAGRAQGEGVDRLLGGRGSRARDFSSEIFLTSTSVALASASAASRSSSALASSVSARLQGELAVLVLAQGEEVLGDVGGDPRLLQLGAGLLHLELPVGRGGLGSRPACAARSLPASEAERRFSSRSEANCGVVELHHAVAGLDRGAVLGHPADLELERVGARHGEGSPRSASSSPVSSSRWRKVPRWATSSARSRAPRPRRAPPPEHPARGAASATEEGAEGERRRDRNSIIQGIRQDRRFCSAEATVSWRRIEACRVLTLRVGA